MTSSWKNSWSQSDTWLLRWAGAPSWAHHNREKLPFTNWPLNSSTSSGKTRSFKSSKYEGKLGWYFHRKRKVLLTQPFPTNPAHTVTFSQLSLTPYVNSDWLPRGAYLRKFWVFTFPFMANPGLVANHKIEKKQWISKLFVKPFTKMRPSCEVSGF